MGGRATRFSLPGILALSLIHILHSGSDFVGGENPALLSAARQMRVVIVPVANPDGRARVQPASMLGGLQDDLSYWGNVSYTHLGRV